MKRIPELRDLSDDHHGALVLAQRCKEAGASHVRYEERDVFEATQHRLPGPALDAIAAACRRRRP